MRLQSTVFLAIVLLVAGCAGSPEPTPTVSTSPSDDGLPDFKPVEPEPEEPRTLAAAPKWKQGEWWKVRLIDVGFTGTTYEATRVVIGTEGDSYLVGMPRDAFSHDFMVLHNPGFGQVMKEDLSFEIHDVLFQPLKFPLVKDDTWTTAFEGRPVTMTVRSAEGNTAVVQMQSENNAGDNANITYDAELGEIVKFDQPGYASYEIIEHGFNYTGIVTVPHMHDVIFQHFRIGPAWNGAAGPGALPPTLTDTVDVDTTYDRVSFGLIFIHVVPGLTGNDVPNAGGYYHELARAPPGETYELTVMPTDPPVKILTIGQDMPGGQWTFEHQAGGPGVIGAEGIAYHIYDVDMPSGRVLPSMGEHQHGG